MSLTIYYFSATGNSLHIAKVLGRSAESYRLVAIPTLKNQSSIRADSEYVGLVFPMHYFGLPPAIEDFASKLILSSTVQYLFAAVTCGNHHFASCFQQLNRLLAPQQRQLAGGFYIDMISTYLPLADIPRPEQVRQRLQRAQEKAEQVASWVAAKKQVVEPEYLYWPCRHINTFWKQRLLADKGKQFYHTPACLACGRCAGVCPANNIIMTNEGLPKWRSNCQECLACLHLCPASCIEFGQRTRGRTRYHHPAVQVEELILPQ